MLIATDQDRYRYRRRRRRKEDFRRCRRYLAGVGAAGCAWHAYTYIDTCSKHSVGRIFRRTDGYAWRI